MDLLWPNRADPQDLTSALAPQSVDFLTAA